VRIWAEVIDRAGAQRSSAPSDDGSAMKAISFGKYGPPEVLKLRDVGLPVIGDDELLIPVRAASARC